MILPLQALSEEQLFEVISILPEVWKGEIRNCIQCKADEKRNPNDKDSIRGQYLSGQGSIIIYGFTKEEIENFEYVDIIYHEIGHKSFDEFFTRKEKSKWAESRRKDFPIKLDDVYLREELWEEEFCIVFSLIMAEYFFRRSNMTIKAKKIERGLGQLSQEAKTVKKLIKETFLPEKNKGSSKEIYSQKVHQRVLKWIEQQ